MSPETNEVHGETTGAAGNGPHPCPHGQFEVHQLEDGSYCGPTYRRWAYDGELSYPKNSTEKALDRLLVVLSATWFILAAGLVFLGLQLQELKAQLDAIAQLLR